MKRAGEAKGHRKNRKDYDHMRLEEDDVPEDFYKFPGSTYGASQGLKHDESEFLEAVKNLSVNRVRAFLDQGVDPNFTILPKRETLLHVAVRDCSPENPASEKVIRLLLFFGCNPNALDNEGCTPLHIACAKNNHECVEMLLQIGADANATNHWFKETPLMTLCSVWEPRLDTIKLLVDHGADTLVQNHDKQNVLHLVCCSNLCRSSDFEERSRIVGFLLDQGVPCDQLDVNGKTPLGYELLRLIYFFQASDDTGCQATLRSIIKVALALVAGGSLSKFHAHENDLKSFISVMILVRRARWIFRKFFVSIRNVVPFSEFCTVMKWIRDDLSTSILADHLSSNFVRMTHGETLPERRSESEINVNGYGDEVEHFFNGDGCDDEEDAAVLNFLNSPVVDGSRSSRVDVDGATFDGDNSNVVAYNGGGGGSSNDNSGNNNNNNNSNPDSSDGGGGSGCGRRRSHPNNNSNTTTTTNSNNHDHHDLNHGDSLRCKDPLALLVLSKMAVRHSLGGRVCYLVSFLETVPKKIQDYLKSIP